MTRAIGPVGVRVMGYGKDSGERMIDDDQLAARAERSCPVGTAACAGCFDGIEVFGPTAEGTVDVTMRVGEGHGCGADVDRLAASMGRLEAQLNPSPAAK